MNVEVHDHAAEAHAEVAKILVVDAEGKPIDGKVIEITDGQAITEGEVLGYIQDGDFTVNPDTIH